MTEADTIQEYGISLSGVSHDYAGLDALARIDLEITADEVVGIVGPSGCGKSTLLSAVCGLLEPTSGEILIGESEDRDARTGLCAYMPQRDLLLPWLSALDNAVLAPRLAGIERSAAREYARGRFERFGLGGFEDSMPDQLSGGMRQRVALLRTLIADRPVLCLDEPFSALDAISRADLQSWLAAILTEDPRTCLLVTHDVEESLYLCDRTVVLSDRPAHIVCEIESPAPRAQDRVSAISHPDFVGARQTALRALGEGQRPR